MRVLAVAALVAALVVSPVFGQGAVSDEYLVVPEGGKGRFGSWALGTPESEMLVAFTRAFGSQFKAGKPASLPKSGRYYFWPLTGFQFISCHNRPQKPVVAITVFRPGNPGADAELRKFRTEKGISVGSSVDAVKVAYGEPTRELRWPDNPNKVWSYRPLGLYIEINPSGTVDALGVYDPSALNDC
jgi:hypothetical protein